MKILVLTLVQLRKTSSQEWWEVKTHLQRSKSPITDKVVITLINDNYCTCMEIGFVLLNICHSEFLQEHLGSGSETEPPVMSDQVPAGLVVSHWRVCDHRPVKSWSWWTIQVVAIDETRPAVVHVHKICKHVVSITLMISPVSIFSADNMGLHQIN